MTVCGVFDPGGGFRQGNMSRRFIKIPTVRQVGVFRNEMPFSLLFTCKFNLEGLADLPPFRLGTGPCVEG